MGFGSRFKNLFKADEKEERNAEDRPVDDSVNNEYDFSKGDGEYEISDKAIRVEKVNYGEILDKSIEIANEKPVENDNVSTSRNFKYLDDLIHSGVKNIVLDSNIVLDDKEESDYKEGIKLDVDDLVIDAGGHTIDSCGKTRIFQCCGRNIKLKNIALKNGFVDGEGGAIKNDTELTIVESALIKNSSDKGGAIANHGKLTVVGTELNENESIYEGGAIMNAGELNISDCELNQNIVEYEGGAIFSRESITIHDSNFNQNSAKYGGAVLNRGSMLIVTGSTFNHNVAKEDGGAIDNNGELRLEDCNLLNNTSTWYGGAIEHRRGKLTVIESTISQNTASQGGALYNGEGELSITKTTFIENSASSYGGVIYSEKGKITITGSTIDENSASKDGGAIYYFKGDFKIINCVFSKNKSSENIILNNDSLKVYGSDFKDNEAENIILNNDQSEHHILNNDEMGLGIYYGSFVDNKVRNSAICNNGNYLTVDSTVFENNSNNNIINTTDLTLINPKLIDDRQSILNNGHILLKKFSPDVLNKIYGEGIVETDDDVPFVENNFDFGYLDRKIHESDTGEITLNHDISFEKYEKDFYEGGIELDIDDLIIDGKGKTIDANSQSRIFLVSGNNITLKNLTFKCGQSYKDYGSRFNCNGGAIKISSGVKLSLIHCKFLNNASENDGGAIDNRGELIIIDSKLKQNTAKAGGAIKNMGKLNINDSEFNQNTAKYGGSAIINEGELTIVKSGLYENNAKSMEYSKIIPIVEGGAIYNKGMLTISQSVLNKNTAKYGAAIDNRGKLKINESLFSKNGAEKSGSALYNIGESIINKSTINQNEHNAVRNDSRGDMTITESTLDENGNALNNSGNLKVIHCEVNNNEESIYNGGELTISESTLTGNSSQDEGGAIYNNYGTLIISKSVLNKNTAKSSGGAVFNKANLTISESRLNENTSYACGGAVYNKGNLTICGSSFNENSAVEYGGAIYNWDKLIMFESILNENTANSGGAICNYHKENVEITKCNFRDNKPEDIVNEYWKLKYRRMEF